MPQHSPSPTPQRAVYGFVWYLSAYICLGIYLVWAYIPNDWLHAIGLTYWPQKYWAVAAPTWLCVGGALCLFLYVTYNFINTLPLNSVNTVTDKHSLHVKTGKLSERAIAPIGDMDISEVNRVLYGHGT